MREVKKGILLDGIEVPYLMIGNKPGPWIGCTGGNGLVRERLSAMRPNGTNAAASTINRMPSAFLGML